MEALVTGYSHHARTSPVAPLSRENYPCVIAEQLTGHFKLAAKEQLKACWVLLVPASSVVSLTAGIIQKSLNITQELLAQGRKDTALPSS